MIHYTRGDLLKSDCQALVNTVNCIGVMGGGIALQFRKAFPDMYWQYHAACKRKDVVPGKMHVFKLLPDRWIINFPTKLDWIHLSQIGWIEEGLDDLVLTIKKYDIQSIAIPPLGCGLGGLNWQDNVGLLVVQKLKDLNCDVQLYAEEINVST